MKDLEQLKAQADELGIAYGGNISAATLQERINKVLNPDTVVVEEPVVNSVAQIRAEATRLIRVVVTPTDTLKRDYHGEFFEVSNRILKVKRFVPFGVATHVEKVLFDELSRRMTRMTVAETRNTAPESRLVKAFAIQELPPLTPAELESLAKAQQARNSIE